MPPAYLRFLAMNYIIFSNNKAFGSVDCELSKVRSEEKRTELFNVLHGEDPDHYSRLWMVGFLKYVGYSLDEICDIIKIECCWSDFDESMTFCQVRSLFKGRNNNIPISSQFRKEAEAAGNPFQRVSNERARRPCAIKWVACKDCPDLLDHHCKWVTRA